MQQIIENYTRCRADLGALWLSLLFLFLPLPLARCSCLLVSFLHTHTHAHSSQVQSAQHTERKFQLGIMKQLHGAPSAEEDVWE